MVDNQQQLILGNKTFSKIIIANETYLNYSCQNKLKISSRKTLKIQTVLRSL